VTVAGAVAAGVVLGCGLLVTLAANISGFVPAGARWRHSAEFDESAVAASADGGAVYVDLDCGVAYFRVIP